MRRFRFWRVRRRIERVLREDGWPANLEVFTGRVNVSEKRYAPGTFTVERIGEGEWPR